MTEHSEFYEWAGDLLDEAMKKRNSEEYDAIIDEIAEKTMAEGPERIQQLVELLGDYEWLLPTDPSLVWTI
jgi:hypothetical protein